MVLTYVALLLRFTYMYLQYLNLASLKDPAINDVEDFKHLEQSMDQVGLSMEEKYNLFQVVAAVFHLGNITFEEIHLSEKVNRHSFMYTYIQYSRTSVTYQNPWRPGLIHKSK